MRPVETVTAATSAGQASQSKTANASISSIGSSSHSSSPQLANILAFSSSDHFDLISELHERLGDYVGEEPITIYNVASYIRSSIDRLRIMSQAASSHRPSLHSTVCACIAYGASILADNCDLRDLISLREQLDMSNQVGVMQLEELGEWFRSFGALPVVADSGGTARRLNIRITKPVRNTVSSIAGESGCSVSTVAMLAMLIALREQEPIMEDCRKRMAVTIDTFYQRVSLRLKVARVLVNSEIGFRGLAEVATVGV